MATSTYRHLLILLFYLYITILLVNTCKGKETTTEKEDIEENGDDDDGTEAGLRHGLDLFTRRFPEPFVLASGAQRNSNSFRGSYITRTTTSSMVLEMYDTAAFSRGSQFGQWVIPQDQYPWDPFSKVTVSQEQKYGPTNYRILLNKLFISAILRDNIVTSLGYVLYRPENALPEPLYTSLYLIYNYVRLRRIHTTEYVHILKEMSNSPPQTQFLILFQEMEGRLPKYLKGTAEVWLESLILNKVNLTQIIRPNGGPVVVDLLATLPPSVLEILNQEVRFQKKTIENASEIIKDVMGNLFSYVFSGLQDGSIILTQYLFALILVHLPLDRIVPQADEVERYIVDALRVESVKHWDDVVKKLRPEYFVCPFLLTREILKGIAEDPEIDDHLRRNAIYLIPYINIPTNTFTNTYYQIMSEVFGQPTIQYKNLLQHITAEQYPEEVVHLKNRLIYYINHGYINMDLVAAGFIRHDYIDPVDLLIALMTRIIQRLSYISDEILSTVKAFQQVLIFKKLACSMSPVPDGFIYIPALAEAFQTPDMSVEVRELGRKLTKALTDTNIDWGLLVNNTSSAQCASPKQCFITLMNEGIKYLPINSSAINYFEELLLRVDSLGRPQTDDVSQCKFHTTEPSLQFKIEDDGHFTIFPPNIHKTTHHRSIANILDANIRKTTPIPIKEPTSTPPPDTKFPPFIMNMFYIPLNFDQREQLLPPTVPFSPEDLLLKPIRDFILREDLLQILGKDFDPNRYTNKAWMLRGILEKAITLDVVRKDKPLYTLLRRYLNFLIHEMEVRKPEINYFALLESLPHATNETEFRYFQIIRNFFISGEVKTYMKGFDISKYNTRGSFMKGLLLYLLSLQELQAEKLLHEAMKYYADKVYLNGFGAKSIEYTIIKQTVTRRTVNLQSTFQAIDTKSLDKEGKKALRGMYKFFGKEFEPPIHMSSFEIMDYKSKGEWLRAFLKYLIKHPAVSQSTKESLKGILPHVLLTGAGAESVD